MFSERTAWDREPSGFIRAKERLANSGAKLLDLTGSNPTQVGFVHDTELFHATRYTPDPLGLPEARRAIADYYRGHGAEVSPDRIWIGAGTSELYAQLMWMLCDPGDTILVPRPGYPLFDYLADLCGVRLEHYPMLYDGAWHVDVGRIVPGGAKAVVAVSPHNPTGHVLQPDELAALETICAERGMALIVDEVFLDYPMRPSTLPSCAGERACLSFTLSGLSKVAALPQCKVSWAVVSGPEEQVREVMARAELVSDTFLNASTIMQGALPALLSAAPAMQERIRARCRENLNTLRTLLRDTSATVLAVDAGWTALVKLPAVMDDAVWALNLLERERVLVQPGYLFDMHAVTNQPHIALSLITPPDTFEEGVLRLSRFLDAL